MNVLDISFSQNFSQNLEITKASIKLSHYKIRIRKLFGHNLWLSFIAIFTFGSDAFSLTSGVHAETLITLLKVNTSRQLFCCVCIESRAILFFSESLNPKEPFIKKV